MKSEKTKSFRSDKYVVSHPVEPQHEGLRLDAYVHLFMPTLSREFVKKKIEKGEVTISGRTPPHKSSTKVHHGEQVTITTHNSHVLEDEHWQGEPLTLTEDPVVVYEDDHIIACHKPAFMTTHPAGRHLFYVATVHFSTIHGKTIHSIHRLDRETSGLLLLGKSPEAAQRIGSLFEEDKIRKCYFLIAHKNPGARAFPYTAHEPIGARPGVPRGMQKAFHPDDGEGKEAETSFELLLEKNGYVLALAFPVTGRQHQIRVHAAIHGYPLLGDKLYNGDPAVFMRFKDNQATPEDHELMQIPRQALHALALRVPYPDADVFSLYRAPLAEDLAVWLKERLSVERGEVEELIEKRLATWHTIEVN
jgi:23S rRNA pseudouridine1911/1915/1917 synthase